MTMNVDSPRFGSIEIEPSKIIEFPSGIPGFEDIHRYALLQPEGADAGLGDGPALFILQSVDDPTVAFNITDPRHLGFNYEIQLADEDVALLKLSDPAAAAVMVILLKDATGNVRANLNAPLVLNLEERLGIQHVFTRLNYEVTLKGN